MTSFELFGRKQTFGRIFMGKKYKVGNNHFQKIIKVAIDLFRKQNFPGTSMQEIGDAVGLHKGSLYYYISSKEELLFDILDQAISNSIDLLSKTLRTNLNPTELLRCAILHHIRYTTEHQSELAILIEDAKHLSKKHQSVVKNKMEQYEKIFQEIIEHGIRNGEFEDVNPQIATFAILGLCNWIYRWFSWRKAMTPEEIGFVFANLVLHGLQKSRPFTHLQAAKKSGV